MFTDKALKEKMKALEVRLETLEHQEFGLGLDEVRKANHKLSQAHHNLDLKFSRWRGIAAAIIFVVTVLGGFTAYYLDQYRKNIEQYQTFEVLRPKAYDLLVDVFQEQLADTLDRISLLDPSDEDKGRVVELVHTQEKLGALGVAGPKFEGLSSLTEILKLIVIEDKLEEARNRIKFIKAGTDDFIVARALTLDAIAMISPERACTNPSEARPMAEKAARKDSSVAAAFNATGICLTEEAKKSMSGQTLHSAQRNFELAFILKPSAWANIRFRNNKVWANAEFLLPALEQNKLDEALRWTNYETIEAFIDDGKKELAICKELGTGQPSYWETEAELYGLEYAYYQKKGDVEKAKSAFNQMKQLFGESIELGRYRQIRARHPTSIEAEAKAIESLHTDNLLKPLWDPPEPDIMMKIKRYMSSR